MNSLRINQYALAFGMGLLSVLAFAPFSLFPISVLTLVVLFTQWHHAANARVAAKLGLAFGLGLFGAGISWIYVALHDYGGMPWWLAVLATALFSLVLALFPALAGLLQARMRVPVWMRLVLVLPTLWVLAEWVRGLIFTGFPWLAFGYAQAASSPLAGYAPILGVYGVSLAVSLSAGLFALLWQVRQGRQGQIALAAVMALWFMGVGLRSVEWTEPAGELLKVSLVQGNIAQDLKFREDRLVDTLEIYRKQVLESDARLIVLPESALPMLRHEVPESYVDSLRKHMRQNNGDVLIGAFELDHGQYYNSVFSLGAADSQSYRKNHLVPFGEFIPLRPVLGWFINDILHIPMSDLARGGTTQPVLQVAGQSIAVNICYEDVFGEEIIRALPAATLLVNVSNDAWYGDSFAAVQHNQISQMRALETGRMMLRATNTGVTSVILRNGHILQMLPQHEPGVLNALVQGYTGATPYVRWGNALLLLILAALLGTAVSYSKR